jgi:Notch 1
MVSTEREFFHAILTGDQTGLDSLLQRGIDISAFRQDGLSPIHFAIIKRQNTRMLDKLINAGCDIDAADNDGKTALHWACDLNLGFYVGFLLDKGARVDVYDKSNKLPGIPPTVLHGRLRSFEAKDTGPSKRQR